MKKKHSILLVLSIIVFYNQALSQITVYPNSTNFESEALCGTSCSGSCNPAGTWRNADQWGFTQAGTDWLIEDGPTPSTATGPDFDHTLGTALGKYIYVETSGCTNTQAHLVSDIFDFSALAAPKINFWYHMFGATMGTMSLDVDTTGLGNWVLDVVPAWTSNANIWQETTIDLSTYAGRPSVRLRIRGNTGTSFTSDMAVDDITVFDPPPYDFQALSITPATGCGLGVETICISTLNFGSGSILAGDSVSFSYSINGGTSVVENYILTANFNPGDTLNYCFTQTADLTIPNTYTIVAVVNYLGDTINNTNDTTLHSITNIPEYTTFPVIDDFEGGQNGWLINNGTTGTWAFGTPAGAVINSAASGVNAFCTGNLTGSYNNNDVSYVQGVCYNFSTVCDPTVRLKVWWNAEFSWDGANITTSTDGGVTWQLVGALGDPYNWYTDNSVAGNPGGFQTAWSGRNSTANGSGTWVTSVHKLNGLAGQSDVLLRINFGTDGSVVDQGFAFDDVEIYDGINFEQPNAICIGGTTQLNAYGGAGDTYLWNTGETTQTITVDSTGWYSCSYSYTAGPCTNMDSVFVTVIDSTTENFVTLGSDVQICDTTASFFAGYMSSIDWDWSTGDTITNITLNGVQSTQLILTGTSTLAGCPAVDSDTVQVDLYGFNTISLGADTSSCGDLILDAGSGQLIYLWSNGNVAQTLDINESFGPGTYNNIWVEVYNSNGCVAYDTINVTLFPQPSVSLGADQTSCTSVLLDAGSGFTTYNWSNGATTQTTTISSTQTVSIIVENSDGCIAYDTVGVNIIDCSGINEVNGLTYHIYPNPATEMIYLTIESVNENSVQYQIINHLGAVVKVSGVFELAEGNQTIGLNIEDLAPGNYILRLLNNEETHHLRFVKTGY